MRYITTYRSNRRFASRSWRGGLALVCALFVSSGFAQNIEESAQLLTQADAVKTSNHDRFISLLRELQGRGDSLSPQQALYLRYLQGWKHAYDGEYRAAIPLLRAVIDESEDPTLQFRAGTTIVNVFAIAAQYKDAFTQLSELLELLPKITDGTAREQGLGVAAYLYNQVGEYDLALLYATRLIDEDWAGRGECNGGQLKLEALYKSGRLSATSPDIAAAIEACERIDELAYANQIRTYVACLYIDEGNYDQAIKYLTTHYSDVLQTRYPHLIAEYDALLATAYKGAGVPAMARQYALRTLQDGVQRQHTAPQVAAYRLLYELAEARGDFKLALDYQKKYIVANRAYIDDVSARQIAYEKVKHEILANQLQISALNKQNQILQLERENNRLYIALLISVLAFIGLWAYKTKRLQVHFMRLSQKDGLTGIANRPHFIDRAEHILETTRKSDQEMCVALCDLDYFKAINDRFGHAAGDFVLKKTVAACQSHLRPQDLFGRFGGEEFGIVLASCALDVARERCEQLRAAIESITAAEFGMHTNVTASFGVASTKFSGYDLRLLLAHADSALYEAKRAGRNCVVAYDATQVALHEDSPQAEPHERFAGVG